MLLESNLITFKVEGRISLLLTLALEGSQLHATESAEVTNGKRLRLKVVGEAIRVNRLWG